MPTKPPQGRRRRSGPEAADFRTTLISAARELFSTDGFESVTIRKITQRAKCPPMTFYVYFKSKRALLYHIWEDVFAELTSACEAALHGGGAPAERVQKYAITMANYWMDHPDSYRIVYMTEDFVEQPGDRYFSETMPGGGRLLDLETEIGAGVAQGAFRDVDPVLISQVIVSAAIGLAHSMVTIPEFPWRGRALISATFDVLLRGLARDPASGEP